MVFGLGGVLVLLVLLWVVFLLVRGQKLEGIALQILEETQECLGLLKIMLAETHTASAESEYKAPRCPARRNQVLRCGSPSRWPRADQGCHGLERLTACLVDVRWCCGIDG